MPRSNVQNELLAVTSRRGQRIPQDVLDSLGRQQMAAKPRLTLFYRDDQARGKDGKWIDEGRGETGAIIDHNTGKVLEQTSTGLPVSEEWQPNVNLPIHKHLDKDIDLIHTHPDESSLSDGDMAQLGWSNVKKIEAVTKSGVTYSVSKPEKYGYEQTGKRAPTPNEIRGRWNEYLDAVTPDELENKPTEQIIHEITQKVSKDFGFNYTKSKGSERQEFDSESGKTQERDKGGRYGDEGKGSTEPGYKHPGEGDGQVIQRENPSKRPATEMYSPNEGEMNFDQARNALNSEDQKHARAIADNIDKQLGLTGSSHDGIGDWSDGAENSVVHEIDNIKDFDQLRYSAALKGKALNQKAVLAFGVDESGKDALHTMVVPSADLQDIRKQLDANGVQFRTLLPNKDNTHIVVFDQGNQLGDKLESVAKHYGVTEATTVKGQGEFVGEADTREAAGANYDKIISDLQGRYGRVEGQGLHGHGRQVTPELTGLDKKIVDYKPGTRPLGDPSKILNLSSILPNTRYVPYSKAPYFDAINAMQGVDPNKVSGLEYKKSRDELFKFLPVTNVPLDKIVVTQPAVNKDKLDAMAKFPLGIGTSGTEVGPIQVVRYNGESYILNGHHRLADFVLKGAKGIKANTLTLTDHELESFPKAKPFYDKAAKAKPRLNSIIQEVAKAHGVTGGVAPLKALPAALEKVEGKYDGDWSRLTDLARGRIVGDTDAKINDVVADLEKRLGIKAEIVNHPESGYSDIKFNPVVEGIKTEIQIIRSDVAEKTQATHGLYEKARTILRNANKEKRQLTPKEMADVTLLNTQMAAIFGQGKGHAAAVAKHS